MCRCFDKLIVVDYVFNPIPVRINSSMDGWKILLALPRLVADYADVSPVRNNGSPTVALNGQIEMLMRSWRSAAALESWFKKQNGPYEQRF